MAIDRNEVLDIILDSSSIDEMIDRLDDLDDVELVHCKDCGAIFTSDLGRDICYECESGNVEVVGMIYHIDPDDADKLKTE